MERRKAERELSHMTFRNHARTQRIFRGGGRVRRKIVFAGGGGGLGSKNISDNFTM